MTDPHIARDLRRFIGDGYDLPPLRREILNRALAALEAMQAMIANLEAQLAAEARQEAA